MFNPENGKRIHLCQGSGNGVDQACLMTASNMLIGRGEDGDMNHCVCPVLRIFIMNVNDPMPDDLRDELLAPLAWEILGTCSDDPEVEQARLDYLNEQIAEIAKSILDTPRVRGVVSDWAEPVRCWVAPKDQLYTQDFKTPDMERMNAARLAAELFACVAKYYRVSLWHRAPEIIRAMAAIGDKRPVETVITHDELAEALDR